MNFLDEKDLKKIVTESVNSVMSPVVTVKDTVVESKPAENVVSEAYAAQQKHFPQVSEYVSQKTKDAHTSLYKGYISTLNSVSAKIDSAPKDSDSNHCEYRDLKIDEAHNLNAVWLHELYFANCFDPHSEVYMDSLSFMRLERDFGSFEEWQKHFVACALSAREGWVICGYNMFLRKYVNILVDGHANNVMMGIVPVIVVDMWSHAYYKDYLNDKNSYIASQMRSFNWGVIEGRFQRCEKVDGALR